MRLRQPEETENKHLVRRELDIALDAGKDNRHMSADVDGPDNERIQSTFEKGDDGLHHVKFVPYTPGMYKVGTINRITPPDGSNSSWQFHGKEE